MVAMDLETVPPMVLQVLLLRDRIPSNELVNGRCASPVSD